jgi:hypothetical protein
VIVQCADVEVHDVQSRCRNAEMQRCSGRQDAKAEEVQVQRRMFRGACACACACACAGACPFAGAKVQTSCKCANKLQRCSKMQIRCRCSYRYRGADKMLRCRGADMQVLSSEYQILRLSIGDCAGSEVQIQRCRWCTGDNNNIREIFKYILWAP